MAARVNSRMIQRMASRHLSRCAIGPTSSLLLSSNNALGLTMTKSVSTEQTFNRFLKTRQMSSIPQPKDFVKSEIESNKVVVWSKSYCPFCQATKNLFEDLEIDAKVFELDRMENGQDLQMALQELTGQRTVPNVFLAGKHLGGNDATQNAARSGKLQELLGISE